MRAFSKEKSAFEIQKAALSPMNFQSSDMRSHAVSSDSYETQGLSSIFFSQLFFEISGVESREISCPNIFRQIQ